ncbi:Uncharacterised protein [Klebsiella pneumoniae]|nr:Uncharacterised protein [Klebsiella pneumoniae]
MGMQRRQDIQCVTIKAEQLNFLMQTIFTHHKDFDCHQLDGVLGLAYNLAGEVYSWMEKEEKIVQQNEEYKRRGNEMSNLITTYRRRILKAALLRHQRKTGSSLLVIKLNKGGISTIELTEILLDGLLRKFERLALGEYGNVEGVKALKGIYSNSVDVNGSGEFLTESGKELIDELISELVEFVKKQKPVTAESGNE